MTCSIVTFPRLCQVLVMSAEELKEHEEKEGWSDAESDDADDGSSPLSFGELQRTPGFLFALGLYIGGWGGVLE